MRNWKSNFARMLTLFMILNLFVSQSFIALATGYTRTINMSNNTFDFNTVSNQNKAANENFASGTPNNNAQVTWDNTNLYLGYQSADLAHVNNSDATDKWYIAYFGIPGVAGTKTGINYGGQQPTLPFEAKYHLRFKTGNNNYTSLEVFNGTSWTFSKKYEWNTDMQRDTSATPVHWKIRIPLADLGLNSTSPSLQFVAGMMYQVYGTQSSTSSMWGAIPDDSYSAGFDKNFDTFYEFDLNSLNTAAASQKYLYEFKSTDTSFDRVSFSYTAQAGATTVKIQQSADLGVTWADSTLKDPLTDASNTATVTNLQASKSYKFRLVVSGGTSAGSSLIANATTTAEPPDTQAPSAPGTISASEITKTTAKLSWIAAQDNKAVTGYEVYNGTTLLATVTTNSYDITGLTEATSYAISVKAKDAAGNLSSATTFTLNTADGTAPTVPTDLASSEVSPTGFKLSWKASTDNSASIAYEIYLNDVLTTTTSSTTAILTALTPSTSYQVKLKARDVSFNVSAATDALTVLTPQQTETEAPTVPAGLASASITPSGFTLQWIVSTDNVGVTGYEVYSNGVLVALSVENKYVFTGLDSGKEYKVSVKARDAAGNVSAASTELTVKTPDLSAPTAATELASSAITATGFTLNWKAATDNVGVKEYEVYRDGLLVSKVTGTTYAFTGLDSRIQYRVYVIAYDDAGNKSVASQELSVQTASGTTYANTNVLVTNSNNTFKLLTNPNKSEIETFETSNTGHTGYITWDVNNLYLGYSSNDLAHVNSDTDKRWFVAYFGVPGITGSTTGVEYSGQQPKLPFEAKYHLRFQAGNSNYTSLEEFNGTGWVKKKEYKWNTDMARDGNVTPVFWKIRIPKADLGLQNEQSLQMVMSMLYEAGANGSMWGAVPKDAIDSAGFDKDYTTYFEFDLGSEKTASASQVANYALKSSATKSTTADFSFKASTGATKIVFHQSTDKGKTWKLSTVSTALTPNSTVATVTGLTAETDYKFRMLVTGGENEGSSSIVSLKTAPPPDETAPTAPSQLTSNGVTQTVAKLSWTAATDNVGVVKYEIYSGLTKVGESSTNSFDVTELKEETEYEFTLVALDAAGNKSPASGKLAVKTLAAPATVLVYYKRGFTTPYISYKIGIGAEIEAPGLPLNPSSQYPGFSSISILLDQEKEMTASFNNATTDKSKWDNNGGKGYLFLKGTYTFVPSETEGGAGLIVSGVPDTEAPTTPQDVAVKDKSETSLTLNWKASTDDVATTSYVIYRDNVKVATVSTTEFTDTGLVKDTYYTYKVIARDAVYNASAASKELRVSVNDSIFEKIDRTTDLTKTVATIDGAKLVEKIGSGALTIELTDEKPVVRQVRFELPGQALQTILATNPNAVITMKTSFGSIELPLQALSLSVAAGKVGTLIRNMKITVMIKRADISVNDELVSMFSKEGSEMVMDAVEHKVYAESTDTKKNVFDMLDFPAAKKLSTDPQTYVYVKREFVLPMLVNPAKASVVGYNPTTKKTQFIPALFETRGEQQVVVVKSTINTVFAFIETTKSFKDVVRNKADIEMLAAKGIVKGFSATTFRPNDTVKRGQFAALLVRALGLQEDASTVKFTDVAETNIFAGVIGTAAKTGLVKGLSNGTFNPNAEITRQEMAVMLERAATLAGKPITLGSSQSLLLSKFTDRAKIASWAAPSVAKMVQANIASNTTAYGPTTQVTRSEATVMLKRLMVYIEYLNN